MTPLSDAAAVCGCVGEGERGGGVGVCECCICSYWCDRNCTLFFFFNFFCLGGTAQESDCNRKDLANMLTLKHTQTHNSSTHRQTNELARETPRERAKYMARARRERKPERGRQRERE